MTGEKSKFPNRNIEYMSENKIVTSVFFQKEKEHPHVQTIESHFSPPNGVSFLNTLFPLPL